MKNCGGLKKPHFFTFISPHPHSLNGSLIPISFMHKFLNGQKSGNALLERGCKNWHVKVEGRRFTNGWEKFENENGLELGDFIVFRHEGDFVFQVIVFDPSFCEKEYPHPNTTTGDARKKTIAPNPEAKFQKEIPANIQALRRKPVKTCTKAETTKNTSAGGSYPYFIATLSEFNIKKSTLYLPNSFARKNGLHSGEMILRNGNQGSWPVEVRDVGHYVYIGRGWRDFRVANNLKKGNYFKFELIENGKRPIANFSRMETLQKNAPKVENSSDETGNI